MRRPRLQITEASEPVATSPKAWRPVEPTNAVVLEIQHLMLDLGATDLTAVDVAELFNPERFAKRAGAFGLT
eukprot:11986704-Karenia_brevis.AAC.1